MLTQFWLVCTALLVRVPCPLEVFGWSKGAQHVATRLCSPTHPSPVPALTPLPTSFFPCVALVMPFSRDTLLELSMTLTCLSGAKSLRDPLLSQLLGEWVASSPLAKARWYEATEVAQLPLDRKKQVEAEAIGRHPLPRTRIDRVLMDLNVPKGGPLHPIVSTPCGHHRLEADAHFPPPWGCLPVRRWTLDPTFRWATQQRRTGPNTRLPMGDWHGRMRE